ncbi:low molecular weight phosphatase family protein [Micrococcus lylae]|uniref:arsenate reductase/protein-tyrosine-phosphatase family protein n=1 Tax=Micrococcus lylae TaxID=1273 RepID=UPI0021A42009|nr:low molecular weight phosphatase family protein [Micrococcus lylae]MCT2008030.1 low molecular weight phosphatase family protein [Micrococcus lylae]MCT2071838.1 low molecular weight phosphatase family protein [Micrococcus lylae]
MTRFTLTTRFPLQSGDEDRQALRHEGPFKVLFVCTANICRSAYADVTSRARGIQGVEFGSAGTRALVEHPMDPPMAAEVHAAGDPSQHVARQLTRSLLEEADLVLTMGPDHRRWILDAWPQHGRKVLLLCQAARIMSDLPPDLGLDRLVAHLWSHRSADPADEVQDPYKRGPEAMATAARQIDAAMDVIAPALEHMAQG